MTTIAHTIVVVFAYLVSESLDWIYTNGSPQISRETTFVTDHVRQDGYIDYFAAANAMRSKDLGPQANAAQLLTPLLDQPWLAENDEWIH